MNTRSLICAPARETLRSWAATLEALGSRTETAESLPPGPLPVELVVAQLTGAERSVPLGKETKGVLVLPKPDLAATVALMANPGVRAVLVADYVDPRLLTYASSKLLRGDVFGVAKVMPWGVQVLSLVVGSHEERLQALSSIDQFGRALNLRSRHLDAIQLVADELLMNALYDAPAAATGPLYANVAPEDRPGLQLERPAIVQVAGDGRRLAIGVRDSYGSLTRETLLATLDRCLRQGGQIERKTSGAGLGLYMVANNVTEFIANLLPGTATEVVCVFAIDSPGQQLKHFGIYEEIFARAVEQPTGGRPRAGRPLSGAGARPRGPGWLWAGVVGAALLFLATVLLALWPYVTRPPRGTIRVSVSPPGATIYVNGMRRGVAAPTLEVGDLDVSAPYLVAARQHGFEPAEEAVALARGRRFQEVRLTMRRQRAKAHVTSVPAGAEIWLDGKQTGLRTPSLIDNLEPGRRVAVKLVRYGYADATGELVPTVDETLRYESHLTMAADFTTLTVTSDPPGARLYVNSVDTGLVTPVKDHVLRAGQTYRLEVRLSGRVPWSETVTPKEGEQLTRAAVLSEGGILAIQSNIPCRVTIDGAAAKGLPLERVLPLGTHRVRLRHDRPYIDHAFQVQLKDGGKRVGYNLQFGTLVAPANLRFLVDKVRVTRLGLLPGEHRLTLVDPKTGETQKVVVNVKGGEESELEVE